MIYKWFVGAGIIAVLLTGCKSDSPSTMNSITNEIEQPEHEFTEEQNNELKTSESQTISDFHEPPQNEEKQQNITLDGWEVGVPFSSVINRIPQNINTDWN
jgi:PBP1b-binding outer membrane lipoprotein LpoB